MIDLPKDVMIEKMVLGHIMSHPDSIFEVLDILTEEVFYDVDNRLIFRTALECINDSKVPDLLNIFTSNRTINIDLLTSMTGSHTVDFRQKAETLVNLSLKRKMISIGERLMRDAQNSQIDPFEVNDKYTSELIEALPSVTDGADDMRIHIPQFVKDVEEVQKKGPKGITTGIYSIDKTFGGFVRNAFVLIGARPATGKSAFILNIIEHILYLKKNVGVISLEMDKKEIYERMASTGSKVKHDKFTKGGLDNHDVEKWHQYNTRFNSDEYGRLFVNDKAPLKFAQLRANAIKWKKQKNIEILFIDHIGLISGGNEQSKYMHMSKISRDSKLLAKELGIPVVALCQLSRAVENRITSRPKLSDLKDTGDLEADANVVWFLYGEDAETDANSPLKKVYCECAKNRGGALFNVELQFAKEILKFKDPNAPINEYPDTKVPVDYSIPQTARGNDFIDIPF